MDPLNRPTSASNDPPPPSDIAQDPLHHDASHPSALAEPAAAQQPLDLRMDTDEDGDIPGPRNVADEDDDMPALQDVSDSSDDDDEDDDDESHDVEMRPPSTSIFVSPSSIPSSSTRPELSSRTNSNRRARVEDDDDSERDRRHPSQRTSSRAAANNDQTPPHGVFRIRMMTSNGERIDPPIPLQHPMNAAGDANSGNNNNNANVSGSAANAAPNPAVAGGNRPRPPQAFLNFREPTFGGLNGPGGGILIGSLMSIPLRSMGNQDASGGQPAAPGAAGGGNNNPTPPNFAPPTGGDAIDELLSAVGLSMGQVLGGAPGAGAIPININLANFALGLEEKEDPERAKKLVEGLEDVPVGLVKRLVRVGGTGGGMGEDDSKGGDAGCAICWDNLLDAEGEGFGKPEPASAAADEANAESSSSKPETNQPRIVSLPCAHVFHADCLIPWFSRPRQTTCPTCRFNIDPDNLTYVSAARRGSDRQAAQAAARAANPDAPVADAPAPPEASANPAAPEGNPPATGSPANDPMPGLFTMEMVFGLPLWPPLGQPGAPPLPTEAGQPDQANQANHSGAQPAGGAEDDQAVPENARDVLQRESERHLRDLLAMVRATTLPGENAQGNADDNVNANDEGEDMREELPADRPHRASSAPPPSTAPLPRAPQPIQQGAVGAASPAPAPPSATSPRGTQLPPFLPNLFNTPTGPPRNAPVLVGSGRMLNEVFTQIFGPFFSHVGAGVSPPPAPGQPLAPQQEGAPAAVAPAPAPALAEGGEPATVPAPAPAAPTPTAASSILFSTPVSAPPADALPAQPNNAANNANASPLPNVPPFRLFPFPFPADSMGPRPDPNRPKPAWTLPPAPGPTLRQRIERREREAGLRCYDVSCGIGPSDEEPELSETIKQLSIKGADGAEVCAHRFHTACLVSAERVAMGAHSAELVCKDGNVEVSCPVCRGAGSVTEAEWADGVTTLG